MGDCVFFLSVMLFPHETKMWIPFEGRFQVCQTWDSLVASLWSNQMFADVVLIAEDGSEFRCHRCILSSVSPVFDRMLSQSITSNFKILDPKPAPSVALSAEVVASDAAAHVSSVSAVGGVQDAASGFTFANSTCDSRKAVQDCRDGRRATQDVRE